jgi:hypothetical protein
MGVTSKSKTTETGKMVLLVIIGIIACVFCAKDGFFAPDVEIGEVTGFAEDTMMVTVKLKGAKLKLGDAVKFGAGEDTAFAQTIETMEVDGEKVEESVSDKEVSVKVSQNVAPGAKVLVEYEYKRFNQFAAVLFGLVSVAAAGRIVWLMGLTIQTSDAGLSVRGRQPIPWDAFKEADLSRMGKGIVRLKYTTEAGTRTLTLDDVKHTNFRELIGEVNAHTPLGIELPVPRLPRAVEPSKGPAEGGADEGEGGGKDD